ncbi:hypothetical protein MXM41_19630 [Leclercia adecarboxylata]|uniref:hypothetical protein n=1 Tax=Leclercia adecarboxylata TaxID=83655 RepID=UPI002DBF63C5|nr:hypothetical protein [Leclercia adecarboxylata]MEB6381116.1 hypothetical protein [Leclercia adecarboxylata]
MKFKIQHLQAAVALVITSLQPQPKAVACQPTIVERVYEMGAKVNKTDISDLTAALNEVADDLRSSRAELARYADSDFNAAAKIAMEISSQTIHVAGIAESFVLMLPEKEIIMAYDKASVEFAFVKAIKMVSLATKNYLSLIDQITRKTSPRESGADFVAMQHLLETGNKAASRWM